jgi:hypothetical protein
MSPERQGLAEREAFAQRLAAAKARISPVLPDVDPADLDLILASLLRPFGSGRRFFLRELRPGILVF